MDKRILNSLDEKSKNFIGKFLIQITINHLGKLERCVGYAEIPKITEDQYFDTPMGELLVMVFLASEGKLNISDKQKVIEGIETILRNVFSSAISLEFTVPVDFWTNDIGKMIKKAKEWATT